MITVDEVRNKVQRILTEELGRVEIDRDGDFVVYHESTVTFIKVYAFNETDDADIIVRCECPMLVDVPLTPELYKWVATLGQAFQIGSCWLNPNDDEKSGWLYFRYAIVGNDLDPNELLGALYRTVFTADDLDDMLKREFGGKLFTED